MGSLNFLRTDNGGEFISRGHLDYCDSTGIRREYTHPGKPQQNAVVESVIWRALKGGHAARLEIGRPFSGVDWRQNPICRLKRQPSVARGCPACFPSVLTAPRPR